MAFSARASTSSTHFGLTSGDISMAPVKLKTVNGSPAAIRR